ncbi:methyl-accepting chemotaxis protein [Photobacterium galatheae]|nr:methyl-accepting chemotaxis protein [Photobacterium galatheae]MCM0150036.1 methyl-accepting chemotaxis protein [Photobacterium galatheae]
MKRKIFTKLLVVPSTLCFFMFLIFWNQMSGNQGTLQAMNSIYLDRVIPLQQLKKISDAFAIDIVDAFNKWNIGDISQPMLASSVLKAKENVADTWMQYSSTTLTAEEKVIANQLSGEIQAIKQELMTLLQDTQNHPDTADQIVQKVYALIDPISMHIDGLIRIQLSTSQKIYQASQAQYESDIQIAIFLFILACILGFMISFWIIRKELRVLPEITKAIQKMSDGDFSPNQISTANNELDFITASLQTLQRSIVTIIQASDNILGQLTANQSQISEVIHGNSVNAQRELSEVEQVAAAATELSSTASDVAQNAQLADSATGTAITIIADSTSTLQRSDHIAERVGSTITESATIINELKLHSDNISSVVEVINSISDQTNLLALNAAIEAARAGDQGRGFAVVAEEVRALAAKTQQSTIHIQQIISQLQEQSKRADDHMKLNTELVAESQANTQALSHAFQAISEQVSQISDINTLVATASEEQSSVTKDISQRLEAISQIVQQNTSNANQTMLANDEILALTQHLKKEMSFFKVVQHP